ncbi:MAG: ester cyclase [bacterium]
MNTPIDSVDAINKLVGRFTEAWNHHEAEGAAALFAADYEGFDISESAPRRGQQGARQWMQRYFRAFPDMQFKDGQTVVQGNRAAILWTAQGTHQGYLLNIPPTGRTFAVRGVSFLTIANNQIQRGEYIWDLAELLRCIRLLPELHENDSGQS